MLANNLARPARTSAATTIPAQPRVQVADALQSPTGQSAAVAATTTALALSATPTPSPVAAVAATYTVVSGDIPPTIAQKLNVPGDQRLDWAHQLLALNNMNSTELQVGQVLKLPANTPAADQAGQLQPTVTTTPAPPPLPSPR